MYVCEKETCRFSAPQITSNFYHTEFVFTIVPSENIVYLQFKIIFLFVWVIGCPLFVTHLTFLRLTECLPWQENYFFFQKGQDFISTALHLGVTAQFSCGFPQPSYSGSLQLGLFCSFIMDNTKCTQLRDSSIKSGLILFLFALFFPQLLNKSFHLLCFPLPTLLQCMHPVTYQEYM